jgi:hypothetical protein
MKLETRERMVERRWIYVLLTIALEQVSVLV